ADMSRDATLCDVIVQSARGEQDIHLYVVRHAFSELHPDAHKATLADKKKQPFATLRNAAKPVSYGIAYGITGAALSETINHALAPLGIRCTVEQAQQIVDLWKTKLFPAAGRWLEGQAHAGQRLGYVSTALGRCRYFDIQQAMRKGRAELAAIGRKASNAPIQGTCADMLKLAMVLFATYADPKRAQMVMTVHDELVVHATDDYAQEAASLLKKAMEDAAQALLPVMGRFVVVEPSISDKYDK
ncbi:MAG: DNA polymerase, partial [Chloroflexus sp.]|nr:DNA polymerase [Chloroflexus sp.]